MEILVRYLLALGAFLSLSACDASLEEQTTDLEQVSKTLPEGCIINYAGTVRVVDSNRRSRIFVVDCPSATTVNSERTETHGKTTIELSDVTVVKK